ncbi:MAG: HAD family hydrolase [Bryobacteraceae bacterium]|nr:HAD family hydrolase [Bryobacteraceae bacterium]
MVVFFDIDGTLIDHDSAERTAVSALSDSLGRTGPVETLLESWKTAFDIHYARYLAGELTLQQQRRERLRDALDPSLSDAGADHLSALYLHHYLAACQLYPDVRECLELLGGFPLGIISNGDRVQQYEKLSRNGIADRFQSWTLSAECGVAKPSRAIFDLACASLQSRPSQAVYVGDRLDVDAEGARNAGLHGIWLHRAGRRASKVQDQIHSLGDLPALIQEIARAAIPLDSLGEAGRP